MEKIIKKEFYVLKTKKQKKQNNKLSPNIKNKIKLKFRNKNKLNKKNKSQIKKCQFKI